MLPHLVAAPRLPMMVTDDIIKHIWNVDAGVTPVNDHDEY